MPVHRSRLLTVAVAAAAMLGLAACGGNDGRTGSSGDLARTNHSPQSATDAGLQHIHGLGLSGEQLFIATHTGLFTAPAGQTKARRFGESRQDIMGFSVMTDGRFLGSGHPAPDQSGPPNLGLIESHDGGQTWTNISLEGQADFHTLASAGKRVFRFDGTQGRLMVSSDAGKTWDQRRPPAGIFSLAVDPSSSDRIVTSTEVGLFTSDDAGRRFLELRGELAGLLAWPSADRLYLVDGGGRVLRSGSRGSKWQSAGSIGGQPAAFIAHGSDLYAALTDNTVKRSTDGGRTWSIRATP